MGLCVGHSDASRLLRVVTIRPRYPALTSFGSRPEWSMWAWVDNTASSDPTAKGKGS